MNEKIVDIKHSLCDNNLYSILAPSVFNPTPKRLLSRAERYQKDDKTKVYAYLDDNEYKGIIVFEINDKAATILDIAVIPKCQGKGIGSKLVDYVLNQFDVNKIIAETDDDAIAFYKKYGFVIANTEIKFNTKRYVCICDAVIHHYDQLIDENNDPVHDPEPLQDYMNKWDGPAFIEQMQLDSSKSVLEIGIGTGRLAVRIAPLCNEFYGVDLSPKTIEQAKENLAEHRNITLICDDFLNCSFGKSYDVVYSSLTFMHIKNKQAAINKVAILLSNGGRFVLSIDKSQDSHIDCGSRKITVYPDNPSDIETCIKNADLDLIEHYETEFAHVFVARKE